MKLVCCASVADIALAKEAGFTAVELHGKEVAALSEEAFEKLLKDLEEMGLECAGYNAYCPKEVVIAGPGYDRENTKRYAKAIAERGSKLGIKQVGVGSPFSRNLPEGYDRDLAFKQACEFFSDTAEILEPAGILVGVEALGPNFCNFINTCDEAMDIIKAVPEHKLGLILDFYNMERSGEADRPLEDLVPYILHTHISDDLNGDGWKRNHLLPEKFDIHREHAAKLMAAGYKGAISLETDLPLADMNVKQSFEVMKSF